MIELRRNIKAEKRKQERIALKGAAAWNRAPNGARIRRQHNVHGETTYRNIMCRLYNRRDRRKANMELSMAKYDSSIEIIGRPSVNLVSATKYITS